MKYCRPEVKDYGNLVAITTDGGAGMAHLGIGALAAVSSPLLPSGGGGGVADEAASFPGGGGGGAGDVAGEGAVEPAAGGGPGGGSGGGSGGSGGGGSLPFTGLPAVVIGAVGAAISATGVAVRKYLSRD